LLQPVERVLEGTVKPDRQKWCAECREIFGNEAAPKLLTELHEEHGGRTCDDVAVEGGEKIVRALPRLAYPFFDFV